MDGGAVAQMNIRLDADLKRSGDEAVGLAGFTPTQFLRDIWTGLARSNRGAELAQELRALAVAGSIEAMSGRPLGTMAPVGAVSPVLPGSTRAQEDRSQEEPSERRRLAEKGANYVAQALSAYGLGVEDLPQGDEWDALAEEADRERYGACAL